MAFNLLLNLLLEAKAVAFQTYRDPLPLFIFHFLIFNILPFFFFKILTPLPSTLKTGRPGPHREVPQFSLQIFPRSHSQLLLRNILSEQI